MNKAMWAIFWVQVGHFILLAANYFLAPGRWGVIVLTSLPVVVQALFFALGIALIVLALKSKGNGWLKTFLIMTGAAPMSIPMVMPLAFPFLMLFDEATAIGIFYIILAAFMEGIIGSIVLAHRAMSDAMSRYGKLITTSFFLTGIGIVVFLSSVNLSVYYAVDLNVIGFSMFMVGLVILIAGIIRRKKPTRVKRTLLMALAAVLSLPLVYLIVSYTYYFIAGKELGD